MTNSQELIKRVVATLTMLSKDYHYALDDEEAIEQTLTAIKELQEWEQNQRVAIIGSETVLAELKGNATVAFAMGYEDCFLAWKFAFLTSN